jgi:hypothetical protein
MKPCREICTFPLVWGRQVDQDVAREAAHDRTVNVLGPISRTNDDEARPPIRVRGSQAVHFLGHIRRGRGNFVCLTNLGELGDHRSVPRFAVVTPLAEKGIHFVDEYDTRSEASSETLRSRSDVVLRGRKSTLTKAAEISFSVSPTSLEFLSASSEGFRRDEPMLDSAGREVDHSCPGFLRKRPTGHSFTRALCSSGRAS